MFVLKIKDQIMFKSRHLSQLLSFSSQKLDKKHVSVAKAMKLQARRKTIPQMLQKKKNESRPQVVRPGSFWENGSNTEQGGGFKYFLFSPLFGEDFQFD